MSKFLYNIDKNYKIFVWSVILASAFLACISKVFAIGGLSEPLDIHFDPDQSQLFKQEFDGEKWLQDNKNDAEDKGADTENKDVKNND